MKIKTIGLTLLLLCGFSLQTCDKDDDIDCSCPPVEGVYFDIEGVELINHRSANQIAGPISFSEYRGLYLEYDVRFYGQKSSPKPRWDFSLIPSAHACSCLEDGYEGSEDEKLEQLTLITQYDFDVDHLANDTINDLVVVRKGANEQELSDYLMQSTEPLREYWLELELKTRPLLDSTFAVKAIVELSTGEQYEVISNEVIFKN
ncbi:MAG: hypothetical protein AAGD05_12100 [Bacteroidota bacterium]